jgi:predicted O-methyltransferase YrrM
MEAIRQAQAKESIKQLGLSDHVDFILADAADVLGDFRELEFVLLDCEKEDYIRFLEMLELAPGAIVVVDNVISHNLIDYREYVRSIAGVDSLTLSIGKGLEVSHFPK